MAASSILSVLALASSIVIINASASETNDIIPSVHHYDVKITKGLDLETVNAALSNETLRDANNISDIAVFFKTGGHSKDGSLQPILTYDVPLTVSEINGDDEIKFQYFVDATSDLTPESFDCSDIRLHIILDHEKEIYVTRWLGYEGRQPMLTMDTQIVSIKNIQPGDHTISLLPEGRVGGCNASDFLVSFGGTMVVYNK
ncbi:hypothetical protein [Nitrososphaera viennensis]|uniref:Uncharacterized protein n=2 Tax=Nitrososphaera viennensis TaxID=1034015 RepID=A0A060HII2_9ARCH|nr:hypothetical protein [Nitrososphaera viennensis]AIC16369.1 exported protein of unknown function [Nitrososphaera viennensis EN76]UVS68305.1 hypothetical protein NWT39_10390 [Nitrososphaera viennensis]